MDWHMFIVYATFVILAMYYTLIIASRMTDLESKIEKAIELLKEVVRKLKEDKR